MSQADFDEDVLTSKILTSDEITLISQKFHGVEPPALKWKRPNGERVLPSRISKLEEVSKTGYWGSTQLIVNRLNPKCANRLLYFAKKYALFLKVRLLEDNAGNEYQVTFDIKDSNETETYTSVLNRDPVLMWCRTA